MARVELSEDSIAGIAGIGASARRWAHSAEAHRRSHPGDPGG
jgi:hypothetical protein